MIFRRVRKSNNRGEVTILENRFRWFSGIEVNVFAYAGQHGREFGYDILWSKALKKWPGLKSTVHKGLRTAKAAKDLAVKEVRDYKIRRRK